MRAIHTNIKDIDAARKTFTEIEQYAGSVHTVENNEVVIARNPGVMDFSSDFTVTRAPAGEVNITAAASLKLEVQEGDVTVATGVAILDFNAVQFNLSESPTGEVNIALAKDQVGDGSASGQGLIWDGDNWIAQTLNFVEALFVSTADDSVSNTTTKTAFAPSGVGSATIPANSMVVGQVIEITVLGVISTP